jgi:hypothetical protein
LILNYTDYSLFNEKYPTPLGEYTRLVHGLKGRKRSVFTNSLNEKVVTTARKGINIENCTLKEGLQYLKNKTIKKSNTNIGFIHDILSLRFKDKYAQLREEIDPSFKKEFEILQSNLINDPAFIGMRGFSGSVRQDGSLNNLKNKQIQRKNGSIKIVRR